jgi:uncharacterized protein YjiS (DUF1127 family)
MKSVALNGTQTAIEGRILLLRGVRVMLSPHLAELYGVETRALVQAVKRNPDRFPEDFMFQLTAAEFTGLKSQLVTSNGRGGIRRALPYAFTEQGVAMLSAVLQSPRAVQTSVEIVRAFVRLRRMIATVEELARKVDGMERRLGIHDADIQAILSALKQLMTPTERPRREMGFHTAKPLPARP